MAPTVVCRFDIQLASQARNTRIEAHALWQRCSLSRREFPKLTPKLRSVRSDSHTLSANEVLWTLHRCLCGWRSSGSAAELCKKAAHISCSHAAVDPPNLLPTQPHDPPDVLHSRTIRPAFVLCDTSRAWRIPSSSTDCIASFCAETEVVMFLSVNLLQCALSRTRWPSFSTTFCLKRLSRCQQSHLVVVLGSRLDLEPFFLARILSSSKCV